MRERYQGGSLAGFLIIGGLLALVLVGGLYGLNRYNAQKAAEEVAANEASEEPAPEWNASDEKASEEGRTNTEEPGDEAAAPSTDTEQGTDSLREQPSGEQIPTTGVQPAELPQTGPVDTAFGLVVLGLLTYAGTHYFRSFRS